MGDVVAGVACVHGPGLTVNAKAVDEERRGRLNAGFRRLSKLLEESRPDLLVAITNDHARNFFLKGVPAFCVGVGSQYEAPTKRHAEILKIRHRVVEGSSEIALKLARRALESGFDPAFAYELDFADELSVPFHFIYPDQITPLVPILVNCAVPPLPPLSRCLDFGRFLGDYFRSEVPGKRVAFIATGGIAHWVGTPRTSELNVEFDRWFLNCVVNNDTDALCRLTYEEIEEQAGNGGQEIRNWITLLGAFPDAKGEEICYVEAPEWICGCAMVSLK